MTRRLVPFPRPSAEEDETRARAKKFTTTELAKRVGLHPRTIYRYLDQGLLHEPIRTPGGHRRFDETHVTAVLAAHAAAKAPPPPKPEPEPAPEPTEAQRMADAHAFVRKLLLKRQIVGMKLPNFGVSEGPRLRNPETATVAAPTRRKKS